MIKSKTEDKTCCICGKKIEGWGNNPYPVKDTSECCDECNMNFVIPARIDEIAKSKKS